MIYNQVFFILRIFNDRTMAAVLKTSRQDKQ